MIEAQVSRRDVLKFSALGAAVVALPLERAVRAKTVSQIAASKLPAPYTLPFAVPPVVDGRGGGVVKLEQLAKQVSIIPGFQTTIFGYALVDGKTPPAPTTPGPTIHAQRGTPLTVMQANKLPTVHPFLNYDPWTSTHLHGSASKPQYDGYASDITKVGQTKRYIYPNKQDARTLWYHDHGVHHTAENAYMGLAAQYHLHDDVEKGLTIPKWEFGRQTFTTDGVAEQFDLPLVLADKMFSANGEFRYDDAGHTGLWGDVVLVNGRAMAEPQGLQAQVPLPGAQRVDLPRLPVADEQQRTDQRDRYGRRPDAAGAGDHAAADRHGRALRDRHRLLEVHHGHQAPAAQPGRAQLHATSTTPARSCSSRSSDTPSAACRPT